MEYWNSFGASQKTTDSVLRATWLPFEPDVFAPEVARRSTKLYEAGMRFLNFCVIFLSLVSSGSLVRGQIDHRMLDGLGLEQAWLSRVQVNPSRRGLVSITLSTNHSEEAAYTVFDVAHDEGVTRFSEFDPSVSGDVLGEKEAERLAEKEVIRRTAMGLNPKLTVRKIPPVTLFATTDAGLAQAFDAETGRLIWSVSIGNPNYPMSSIGANETFAAVLNGSTLYVLDRNTGNVRNAIKMQASPSSEPHAGPRLSNDWVFVPALNGQMEAFHLTDEREPDWFYRTRGDIVSAPVITPSSAAWTTHDGRLFVSNANQPEILFRLETNSQFASSCAYLVPGQLFVASMNGYVYAIDEKREAILWESSTGKRIVQAPMAIEDQLFLVSSDKTLICLDNKVGETQWSIPKINRVLAVSDRRVYVVDANHRFAVMDKKDGRRLGPSFKLKTRFPIANTNTDRVYLASATGTLMCLREMDAAWPKIYNKPIAESDDASAVPTDSTDSTPPTETPPTSDDSDPFDFNDGGDDAPADDSDDDPFDFGGDEPASNDTDEEEEDPFDFE